MVFFEIEFEICIFVETIKNRSAHVCTSLIIAAARFARARLLTRAPNHLNYFMEMSNGVIRCSASCAFRATVNRVFL